MSVELQFGAERFHFDAWKAGWDASGQSQLVHVLLMLFVGVVGTLIHRVVFEGEL